MRESPPTGKSPYGKQPSVLNGSANNLGCSNDKVDGAALNDDLGFVSSGTSMTHHVVQIVCLLIKAYDVKLCLHIHGIGSQTGHRTVALLYGGIVGLVCGKLPRAN